MNQLTGHVDHQLQIRASSVIVMMRRRAYSPIVLTVVSVLHSGVPVVDPLGAGVGVVHTVVVIVVVPGSRVDTLSVEDVERAVVVKVLNSVAVAVLTQEEDMIV